MSGGRRNSNIAALYEIASLPRTVQDWVTYWYKIVEPSAVYVCDGSQQEAAKLQQILVDAGQLQCI